MISNKAREAILELQKKYPKRRSALIPALHLVQVETGCLSEEIQAEVAALFELSPNEVQAVVTFYDMFHERPSGKHMIHICKNISCMLRGSDELMQAVCEHLKIKPGDTTLDGEVTLHACECMAACDKAPMMLLDDQVIGPVALKDVPKILEEMKSWPGHPSAVPEEAHHA